jgi:septum formation protein
MTQLILASQSPRRKQLLQQLGLIFEIHPSSIDESTSLTEPESLVSFLATQKAQDVASNYRDALIIGSDTIVVLEGNILGKPKDPEEAYHMLHRLSDQSHDVFTGMCLQYVGSNGKLSEHHTFTEKTTVWFQPLEEEEIIRYVNSGNPMDKAGAYGIQDDWGAIFVKKIEGDYYNVVGLPLSRCYRELKKMKDRYQLTFQL